MANKVTETENLIYNLNAIAGALEAEAAEMRRLATVYHNHKGEALNDYNITENTSTQVRMALLGVLNNSNLIGKVESALRSVMGG